MRVRLTIDNGPAAGKTCMIEPGQSKVVGRSDQAGWVLRDDSMISNLHFSVEVEGDVCRLRDLNSKFGTTVNQSPVTEAQLKNGDQIKAGNTVFLVKFMDVAAAPAGAAAAAPFAQTTEQAPTPARSTAAPSFIAGDVLTVLRSQPHPLFAVLDAAQDPPAVFDRILSCPEQHQSLYDGDKGEGLAPYGPFLVSLPKESEFLPALVQDGWSKSWGVFLTSQQPFLEVRKHLRRFLFVQTGPDKLAYFRFYDPRVLRVYLPTCSPQEIADFFGPITCYLMEGEQAGTLARFEPTADGVKHSETKV